MSREVRRVPLDFDWPTRKRWEGYLMPANLGERDCETCEGSGYSAFARWLHSLWYGYVPFSPWEPLTAETPAVRARAERNIARSPEHYGQGEAVIAREAERLADYWNGAWSHHLTQADVDALAAEGRLHDFTHTWTREQGWQPKDPPVTPTAAEVNAWSLTGLSHDSINALIVIEARCKREGMPHECADCDGHGSHEAYPGQRAEAEAWERTDPPEGKGWQAWETVTEGSPISPVFPTAEALAEWITTCDDQFLRQPYESALRFVRAGWAPSLVASAATGVQSGAHWVGGAS